ncbi:MAG: hypothetical protein AB1805_05875 [Nitrospirota bacterium]
MPILTLSPSAKEILKKISSAPDERAVELLVSGIKNYLRECELEILEYETKYGSSLDELRMKIGSAEVPDEFSYQTEKDLMKWEDLIVEKKSWMEVIRNIQHLVHGHS